VISDFPDRLQAFRAMLMEIEPIRENSYMYAG
jgi:hypothetical protein